MVANIVAVRADLTEQETDVVVNAANSSLLGGGGVDGAIHREGGPEILAACRELRESRYQRGLPTGQAVATTAGRLPARWVVHTVGPVWSQAEDRSGLLASCYRSSLRVASELGATSVAFPALSTGAYGWPMEDGARVAVRAVREVLAYGEAGPEARGEPGGQRTQKRADLTEVRFVLFDEPAHTAFERALAQPPS